MLSIEMVEGPSGKRDHTKSSWVRFYSPADPKVYDQMFGKAKNQKLLAKHQFRLDDIAKSAADVSSLAKDLKSFNEKAVVKEFVMPQPINIDQSSL